MSIYVVYSSSGASTVGIERNWSEKKMHYQRDCRRKQGRLIVDKQTRTKMTMNRMCSRICREQPRYCVVPNVYANKMYCILYTM